MQFVKENVNPKGWKREGDCVVRALAGANNMKWEDVYSKLCSIGAKKCRMPNSQKTYEKFLEDYGWVKYKMPKHEDGTKYTVQELIDEIPTKVIVISMRNHLSYARKGTLIDTWNCGSKAVGNYWIQTDIYKASRGL